MKRLIASALMLLAVLGGAGADTFPSRTITVVVPYAAGGAMGAVGRIVAEPLGKTLGVTTVVENRVGGAGIIIRPAQLYGNRIEQRHKRRLVDKDSGLLRLEPCSLPLAALLPFFELSFDVQRVDADVHLEKSVLQPLPVIEISHRCPS